jgi:hypothetical protein
MKKAGGAPPKPEIKAADTKPAATPVAPGTQKVGV